MIRYTGLSKSFGHQVVLEDVHLSLDQPGFHALIGPNGSGKTTLMKSTLGLVKPDRGTVEWDSEVLKGDLYRNRIAYLPQIARFPENLSPNEFFQLIEQVRGISDRKDALKQRFGLEPFSNKALRSLSGGMRQKVNIVGALMYDTQLLLLDEPTIGLDPVALRNLKDFLLEEKRRGKYILVTTHISHLVEEMADTVLFILDGRLYFQGTPSALCESTGEEKMENAIAQVLESHHHV